MSSNEIDSEAYYQNLTDQARRNLVPFDPTPQDVGITRVLKAVVAGLTTSQAARAQYQQQADQYFRLSQEVQRAKEQHKMLKEQHQLAQETGLQNLEQEKMGTVVAQYGLRDIAERVDLEMRKARAATQQSEKVAAAPLPEVAPIMGSPAWLKAQKALADIKQAHEPAPKSLADIAAEAKARAQAALDVKNAEIDKDLLADKIYQGQESLEGIQGSFGLPIRSVVETILFKKYPKFNRIYSTANAKWRYSPKAQFMQSQIQGSLPRLQILEQQLDALKNTDIPAINEVLRFTSRQTGKPEYVDFESNRNAIIQEVNTALSGSSQASDYRIRIEMENLMAAQSPAQIKASIKNLNRALMARLDTVTEDLYPQEVVQGTKTLEQYRKELDAKYRGKYSVSGEATQKKFEILSVE